MSVFGLMLVLLGLIICGYVFRKSGLTTVMAELKKSFTTTTFLSITCAILLLGALGLSYQGGSLTAFAFLIGGWVAIVLCLALNICPLWMKKALVLWSPLLGFSVYLSLAGDKFYTAWIVLMLGYALISGLVLLGFPHLKEVHSKLMVGGAVLALLMVAHMQFPLILGGASVWLGIPLMVWFVSALLIATSLWMGVMRLVKALAGKEQFLFAPVAFVLAYAGIFGVLMTQLPSAEFKHLLFLYTLFGSALGGLWAFLSPIRKWWALILVCLVIYPFDTVAALTFLSLGFLVSTLILSFKASVSESEEVILSVSLLSLIVFLFQGNAPQYFEAPLTWVALLGAWQAPMLYQMALQWKISRVPGFITMLLITAASMILMTWLGTTSLILPFLLFSVVLTLTRSVAQKTSMSPLFVFVTAIFTIWIQHFFL